MPPKPLMFRFLLPPPPARSACRLSCLRTLPGLERLQYACGPPMPVRLRLPLPATSVRLALRQITNGARLFTAGANLNGTHRLRRSLPPRDWWPLKRRPADSPPAPGCHSPVGQPTSPTLIDDPCH